MTWWLRFRYKSQSGIIIRISYHVGSQMFTSKQVGIGRSSECHEGFEEFSYARPAESPLSPLENKVQNVTPTSYLAITTTNCGQCSSTLSRPDTAEAQHENCHTTSSTQHPTSLCPIYVLDFDEYNIKLSPNHHFDTSELVSQGQSKLTGTRKELSCMGCLAVQA